MTPFPEVFRLLVILLSQKPPGKQRGGALKNGHTEGLNPGELASCHSSVFSWVRSFLNDLTPLGRGGGLSSEGAGTGGVCVPDCLILSLQKEPSEVPTPKRPRGRPKGSKNKGAAKTRVRKAGAAWARELRSLLSFHGHICGEGWEATCIPCSLPHPILGTWVVMRLC